jgi:TM2 domain-containing membrane protein YozV
VTPAPRSLALAYVLCLVLGPLGAHRFYLRQPGAGAAYAFLTVVGILSAPWGIGFVFGGLVLLACLVDLLLMPGRVRRANGDLN